MTAIDLIRPAKPVTTFWHTLSSWFAPKPKAPSGRLPQTDKFMRDTGLSATQRELLELQWPSQTTRHPML